MKRSRDIYAAAGSKNSVFKSDSAISLDWIGQEGTAADSGISLESTGAENKSPSNQNIGCERRQRGSPSAISADLQDVAQKMESDVKGDKNKRKGGGETSEWVCVCVGNI